MNNLIDLSARRKAPAVAEASREEEVPERKAQPLNRITILRATLVDHLVGFLMANGLTNQAQAISVANQIINNALATEMQASLAKPSIAPKGPAA